MRGEERGGEERPFPGGAGARQPGGHGGEREGRPRCSRRLRAGSAAARSQRRDPALLLAPAGALRRGFPPLPSPLCPPPLFFFTPPPFPEQCERGYFSSGYKAAEIREGRLRASPRRRSHASLPQPLLGPAVPLTWPALPGPCPLSSSPSSSSSRCFTPGKSPLPFRLPTLPSPLLPAPGLARAALRSLPGARRPMRTPGSPICRRPGASLPNAGGGGRRGIPPSRPGRKFYPACGCRGPGSPQAARGCPCPPRPRPADMSPAGQNGPQGL